MSSWIVERREKTYNQVSACAGCNVYGISLASRQFDSSCKARGGHSSWRGEIVGTKTRSSLGRRRTRCPRENRVNKQACCREKQQLAGSKILIHRIGEYTGELKSYASDLLQCLCAASDLFTFPERASRLRIAGRVLLPWAVDATAVVEMARELGAGQAHHVLWYGVGRFGSAVVAGHYGLRSATEKRERREKKGKARHTESRTRVNASRSMAPPGPPTSCFFGGRGMVTGC